MAASSRKGCVVVVISIIILLILLIVLYLLNRPDEPNEPSSAGQYASGWSVKNNADWTPFPPNTNPLGAPNDNCTGGAIPGSWAEFTFPAFSLPAGATLTGIEVRVKYRSPSGSNTLQLTRGGSLVGSTNSLPSVTGTSSSCAGSAFTSAGGSSDLWGSGVTAADFNGARIGVRLTQDANTVDLDAIEFKVYYSP